MNHSLATPLVHDDAARTIRTAIGESLLLRFLVQRGVLHRSLLKLIEIEHAGSGTTVSLLDWLVQRGHLSEETLTEVLAACLTLQPSHLAPFALPEAAPQKTTKTERHLRLVSSR